VSAFCETSCMTIESSGREEDERIFYVTNELTIEIDSERVRAVHYNAPSSPLFPLSHGLALL
jgi:hypothetical protein